jgi:hypothetical protein
LKIRQRAEGRGQMAAGVIIFMARFVPKPGVVYEV